MLIKSVQFEPGHHDEGNLLTAWSCSKLRKCRQAKEFARHEFNYVLKMQIILGRPGNCVKSKSGFLLDADLWREFSLAAVKSCPSVMAGCCEMWQGDGEKRDHCIVLSVLVYSAVHDVIVGIVLTIVWPGRGHISVNMRHSQHTGWHLISFIKGHSLSFNL